MKHTTHKFIISLIIAFCFAIQFAGNVMASQELRPLAAGEAIRPVADTAKQVNEAFLQAEATVQGYFEGRGVSWYKRYVEFNSDHLDPFFSKVAELEGGTAIMGGSDLIHLVLWERRVIVGDLVEVNLVVPKSEAGEERWKTYDDVEIPAFGPRPKMKVMLYVNPETSFNLETYAQNAGSEDLIKGNPMINVPIKHTALAVVVSVKGKDGKFFNRARIYFRTEQDYNNYLTDARILTLPCVSEEWGTTDPMATKAFALGTVQYCVTVLARSKKDGWKFDAESLKKIKQLVATFTQEERASIRGLVEQRLRFADEEDRQTFPAVLDELGFNLPYMPVAVLSERQVLAGADATAEACFAQAHATLRRHVESAGLDWYADSIDLDSAGVDPFFWIVAELEGGTIILSGSDMVQLMLNKPKAIVRLNAGEDKEAVQKKGGTEVNLMRPIGASPIDDWHEWPDVDVPEIKGAREAMRVEIDINPETIGNIHIFVSNAGQKSLTKGASQLNIPLKHSCMPVVVSTRDISGNVVRRVRLYFRTPQDRDNYVNKILTIPDTYEEWGRPGSGVPEEGVSYILHYCGIIYARSHRDGWHFDQASLTKIRQLASELTRKKKREVVRFMQGGLVYSEKESLDDLPNVLEELGLSLAVRPSPGLISQKAASDIETGVLRPLAAGERNGETKEQAEERRDAESERIEISPAEIKIAEFVAGLFKYPDWKQRAQSGAYALSDEDIDGLRRLRQLAWPQTNPWYKYLSYGHLFFGSKGGLFQALETGWFAGSPGTPREERFAMGNRMLDAYDYGCFVDAVSGDTAEGFIAVFDYACFNQMVADGAAYIGRGTGGDFFVVRNLPTAPAVKIVVTRKGMARIREIASSNKTDRLTQAIRQLLDEEKFVEAALTQEEALAFRSSGRDCEGLHAVPGLYTSGTDLCSTHENDIIWTLREPAMRDIRGKLIEILAKPAAQVLPEGDSEETTSELERSVLRPLASAENTRKTTGSPKIGIDKRFDDKVKTILGQAYREAQAWRRLAPGSNYAELIEKAISRHRSKVQWDAVEWRRAIRVGATKAYVARAKRAVAMSRQELEDLVGHTRNLRQLMKKDGSVHAFLKALKKTAGPKRLLPQQIRGINLARKEAARHPELHIAIDPGAILFVQDESCGWMEDIFAGTSIAAQSLRLTDGRDSCFLATIYHVWGEQNIKTAILHEVLHDRFHKGAETMLERDKQELTIYRIFNEAAVTNLSVSYDRGKAAKMIAPADKEDGHPFYGERIFLCYVQEIWGEPFEKAMEYYLDSGDPQLLQRLFGQLVWAKLVEISSLVGNDSVGGEENFYRLILSIMEDSLCSMGSWQRHHKRGLRESQRKWRQFYEKKLEAGIILTDFARLCCTFSRLTIALENKPLHGRELFQEKFLEDPDKYVCTRVKVLWIFLTREDILGLDRQGLGVKLYRMLEKKFRSELGDYSRFVYHPDMLDNLKDRSKDVLSAI